MPAAARPTSGMPLIAHAMNSLGIQPTNSNSSITSRGESRAFNPNSSLMGNAMGQLGIQPTNTSSRTASNQEYFSPSYSAYGNDVMTDEEKKKMSEQKLMSSFVNGRV